MKIVIMDEVDVCHTESSGENGKVGASRVRYDLEIGRHNTECKRNIILRHNEQSHV